MDKKIAFLLLILVSVSALFFLLVEPVAQPKNYLQFADQRMLLGIKNFWNVVSNLPLILLGICGVVMVVGRCRIRYLLAYHRDAG